MKMRGFETTESEIRREKAEALGRAGERLERAFQELLALLATAPESVPDGKGQLAAELERKVAKYTRLCDQTKAFHHALIIQREAAGLWGHEDGDRQYLLPGSLPLPTMTPDEG